MKQVLMLLRSIMFVFLLMSENNFVQIYSIIQPIHRSRQRGISFDILGRKGHCVAPFRSQDPNPTTQDRYGTSIRQGLHF